MLVNHQWWLLIFLVYLLLRIIALKDRKTIVTCVLFLMLTSGRCYIQNQAQHVSTPQQSIRGHFLAKVNADAWRVNGNHAQGLAKFNGHRVLLQVRIKNHRQQRLLLTNAQPQLIQIDGENSPIPVASNRYEFDAQRYYAQKGVFQQVRGRLMNVHIQRANTPWQRAHALRAQLGIYFRSLPQPLGIYAQRLLLGLSDPQIQSTLQFASTLGIIHLFCISGMHVLVLLTILRYVLVHLHVTRESREWLEILLLPWMLIIGGAGNGLSRAIIMTELQLLIKKVKSHYSSDSWSLSLLIHLFIQPGLLVNVGGQLTYLLSFSLRVMQTHNEIRRAIAINVVALPAVLSSFYQVHLISLLANILIVPFFSVLILPGVLISVITWPVFALFATTFNRVLQFFDTLLGCLANFPGMITFGKLPGIVSLLLTILSLWLVNDHHLNRQVLYTIMTIYCLTFLWIHLPLTGEVTFVDIGQGDCAIIRTPFNRRVIMIDTGGQLHFKQARWARGVAPVSRAQRTSINYLKSRGVSRIDALCLSHHDTDHIGYMSDVLKSFKVTKLYVPKGMEKQRKFLQRLPNQQPVEGIISGQQLPAKLLVLHPYQSGQGKNEDSAVLWGRFGNRCFLFTGDLDRKGERQVLKHNPQLKVDVLKLGHHGSQTASDPDFLKRLHPAVAIISAGRRNRYGHPHQITLNNLRRFHIPYLSTQQQGMISYVYCGNYGRFNTQLVGDELSWMQTPLKSS